MYFTSEVKPIAREHFTAQSIFLLWLLGVSVVAVSASTLSASTVIAEYLLLSFSLLLVSAIICSAWNSIVEHILFANIIIQAALVLVLGFSINIIHSTFILHLMLLSIAPLYLNSLESRLQKGASVTVTLATLVLTMLGAWQHMVLAFAAAGALIFLTNHQKNYSTTANIEISTDDSIEYYSLEKYWPAMTLHLVLIVGLISYRSFVQFSFSNHSIVVLMLGLVWLLLGSAILTIIHRAYLSTMVVFNTLVVALVITISSMDSNDSINISLPILLLMVIGFSAVTLGLPIKRSSILLWGILLIGLCPIVLVSFQSQHALLPAIIWLLQKYPGELLLLVTSICLARFWTLKVDARLLQLKVKEEKDYSHQGHAVFNQLIGNRITRSIAENQSDLEQANIVFSLKILTAIQLFSLLIIFWVSVNWLMIAYVVIATCMSLILFRLRISNNFIYLGISFIALSSTLIVLLAMLTSPLSLTVKSLIPFVYIVALGFIPLPMPFLAPTVVCVAAVSYEILQNLNAGKFGAIAIVCSLVISLFIAQMIRRWQSNKHAVMRFSQHVSNSDNLDSLLLLLADDLKDVFDSQVASIWNSQSWLCFTGRKMIDDFPIEQLRSHFINSRLLYINPAVSVEVHKMKIVHVAGSDRFNRAHEITLRVPVAMFGKVDSSERDYETIVRIFLFSNKVPYRFFSSFELWFASLILTHAMARMATLAERNLAQDEHSLRETRRAEYEYEMSNLVHDINNTIQDLTLLCDENLADLSKMANSEATADISTRIRRTVAVARSMASLVSDSRRKRELEGTGALSPDEIIELEPIVTQLSNYAAIRAERKRIITEILASDINGVYLRVSAKEHLEMILRGLLDHAILTSTAGSKISMLTNVSESWIKIAINDNGPGYSAQEINNLLKQQIKKSDIGMSSILSQARWFAEQHGGVFEIESQGAAQGAMYRLAFPRYVYSKPVKDSARWALILEDDASLMSIYARLLNALQLEVICVTNIADAKEKLTNKHPPALLLTDLNLAEGSAAEIALNIELISGKLVPTILITGQDEIPLELQNKSHIKVVRKPVAQRELFEMIKLALKNE